MAATKGAKKASPSKKGEAARAEKQDQPNTFEFRGLKLTLPKKIPLSLAMRYRRMVRDRKGEDLAFLDLVEGVVGPDQYEAIERKMDEDGLTLDDDAGVLMELVEEALSVLGTSPGE